MNLFSFTRDFIIWFVKAYEYRKTFPLFAQILIPTFAWCRPTVAHVNWDYNLVVRRFIRWINKLGFRQRGPKANLHQGGIRPWRNGRTRLFSLNWFLT